MTVLEKLKLKKMDDPMIFSVTFADFAADLMSSTNYLKLSEASSALRRVQDELDFLQEEGEGDELMEPLADLLHMTETQGFINGLLMGLAFSLEFTAQEFWDKYVLGDYTEELEDEEDEDEEDDPAEEMEEEQ